MKRKRRLLPRKKKPQIRGKRLVLESWFTEKRTPINRGKAYLRFNSGNTEKGKSQPKSLGSETLHCTGRRVNFSHRCGRCVKEVEVLYKIKSFSIRICRPCCAFPFAAGHVKIRSLNEVQKRKARANKREKEKENA